MTVQYVSDHTHCHWDRRWREGHRGGKIAWTEKSETNLHKIKSMKEHFCGEMISLQGRCTSPRTVLWSQPCRHFLWPPVSITAQETSRRDPSPGMPERPINGEELLQINKTQTEIRAVGWPLHAVMQEVIFQTLHFKRSKQYFCFGTCVCVCVFVRTPLSACVCVKKTSGSRKTATHDLFLFFFFQN